MASNPFVLDFSPINNALGKWQQQRQFDARLGQQDKQFQAQNALAQAQLGLARRSADRADALAPGQLEMQKAQIDHLVRTGQLEAAKAPYVLQNLIAQTGLHQAQAKKAMMPDPIDEMIRRLVKPGVQPPQGQPMQPQPQSFNGGQPVQPGVQPSVLPQQSMIPGVQLTAGDEQPQQSMIPGPDVVDTPFGKMPIDKARFLGFAMAYKGKGKAGELFTNAANADKMTREARNQIDKDQLNATTTLANVLAVERSFDPKFLEIGTRLNMAVAGWKDKLGNLPEEDKKTLADFSRFKARGLRMLAEYVKQMSGVAVAEAEYKRLAQAMPNPGTSIFDGMGPTQFKAVMLDVKNFTRMAIARQNYLRSKNFKGKAWEAGIELDDMQNIVSKRGFEIQKELRQQGIPPDKIGDIARQKVNQEFGI